MPTVLDAAALRQLCKDAGGYSTPQLNDKLYGNFRGFDSVCSDALGQYTAIKALFLEGNALQSLEGLPELPSLMCMYVANRSLVYPHITSHRFVQHNAIDSLAGLRALRNLVTINISNNCITTLQGLEHCPLLTTLHAANNQLASTQALTPLHACPQLTTLDLQANKVLLLFIINATHLPTPVPPAVRSRHPRCARRRASPGQPLPRWQPPRLPHPPLPQHPHH